MHIDYDVYSVCDDDWAKKAERYWRFMGGGKLYVLLGKTDGKVLLIRKTDKDTGEEAVGLLVEEPLELPERRDLMWHEMGHYMVGHFDCDVENEFQADKWAMEQTLKRGFTNISEEIFMRCMSFSNDDSIQSEYKESSKRLVDCFVDFSKSIVKKYSRDRF